MSLFSTKVSYFVWEETLHVVAIPFSIVVHSDIVPAKFLFDRASRQRKLKARTNGVKRVRKLYFRSKGPGIKADARTRNGRLKEVLLRDKPEVIRLSRGKLSFLRGFFVGLRPPTNIHSRLTLLFTVCGCLCSFLSRLSEFPSVVLFAPLLLFFHCLRETRSYAHARTKR